MKKLNSMDFFESTKVKKEVNLENPTKKSFLKGIIKSSWAETVYERNDHWVVSVKRNEKLTSKNVEEMEEEFKDFLFYLKKELQDNIISVDTDNKAGTYFLVYLKK